VLFYPPVALNHRTASLLPNDIQNRLANQFKQKQIMRTKPPVLDLSQEHTLSTIAPCPSLLASHSQNAHTKGLSSRQLRLTICYIQAHLDEEICLDAIASELGFSRYYFCRLFKQSTGFSPYQYVIRCRIELAKQLLKKGDESIAEIALACGFSHQSHLHRHFKRLTGFTPQKFIKS
jgi:AraC-like DNA-binding protein